MFVKQMFKVSSEFEEKVPYLTVSVSTLEFASLSWVEPVAVDPSLIVSRPALADPKNRYND